jgi:uncharacterized protein (TIGR00369 family)
LVIMHGRSPLPGVEQTVRDDFARQGLMGAIGVSLDRVEAGMVELSMPFDVRLTQQHGFLHAGIVTTLLDAASGFAAQSAAPAGSQVLSVEFTVSLLAPARGERFVAVATVRRGGRRLSTVTAELTAYDGAPVSDATADPPGVPGTVVALMQATMTTRAPRPERATSHEAHGSRT